MRSIGNYVGIGQDAWAMLRNKVATMLEVFTPWKPRGIHDFTEVTRDVGHNYQMQQISNGGDIITVSGRHDGHRPVRQYDLIRISNEVSGVDQYHVAEIKYLDEQQITWYAVLVLDRENV